tara:strand:+ start:3223 stop:3672 length:450 start_codon:yes stop_codon:yes gene_type:complete
MDFTEIDGFDGYIVSSKGDVYSAKTKKILKPATRKDGYKMVCFYKDGKKYLLRVHRLVAQAFIPNPLGLPCVNHINCIRNDNRVENLEWCNNMYNTQSVNTTKSIGNVRKHGLKYMYEIKINRIRITYGCPTLEYAEKTRLLFTPTDEI